MTDSLPPEPPPTGPPPMMPVTEAELHAYADRQLTAERAAEIEDWLARRPDEAGRVRAWDAQKRALRTLFDPVLDEAVPDTLRQVARRRAPWYRHPVAAAIVLALIATGTGWELRGARDGALLQAAAGGRGGTTVLEAGAGDSTGDAEFATRAAIAHAVYTPEVRRPVEVDAEHEDQLVTWLSKRLGAAVKAPHLQALGYALEGGRLLPGDRGPVAQFMYRDDAGHRLTLYVSNETAAGSTGSAVGATRAASNAGTQASTQAHTHADARALADTAFRFVHEGKVNVFYWVDGPFRYAITAASDQATLARVSEEVYRQLAPSHP